MTTLPKKFLNGTPLSELGDSHCPAQRDNCFLKCHPVFCGSALKYVGVQRLLDGVVDYLLALTDMRVADSRT